ncbi:MAG: hypothetical protein IH820_08520, partial [Bacteroidetes bacterium]|nr:hypothetical protein [Bacteroidota bacterium]
MLLVGLAVVGLVLYVLLVPAQHPDAAASYALGRAAAEEAAEAFLTESGYALDEYDVEVALRRDKELLSTLQSDLGRREALRLLRDEAAKVPAYHWRVRYNRDSEEDELAYLIRLTAAGVVWDFERDLQAINTTFEQRLARRLEPGRRIDRGALQAVLTRSVSAPGVEAPAASVDFSALTDSLIAACFSFIPEDSLWRRDPVAVKPFDGSKVLATLGQHIEDPTPILNVTLPPAYAVALARHHLQRTLWDADVFRADSIWLLPERNNRLARVRLVWSEPVFGQQVQTDVTVTAAGAVLELDTDFLRDEGQVTLNAHPFESGIQFFDAGLQGLYLRVEYALFPPVLILEEPFLVVRRLLDRSGFLFYGLFNRTLEGLGHALDLFFHGLNLFFACSHG